MSAHSALLEGSLGYLGVQCQNCGEMIALPDHVLDRQIAIVDGQSNPADHHIATLLNIRCRACRKEYFYDVREIVPVEEAPRSSRMSPTPGPAPSAPKYHVAHR
jgi:hypothetical protein